MAITDHPGDDRWPRGHTINRQLHDLVVPQLFVLSTGLIALSRRDVGGHNDVLVNDLAEAAANALTDLRSISRGQAVHQGGDLHRVAARLRAATETAGRLTDCEVGFDASGEAIVPAALEDDLVAVTREGLANAIRHGGARHVDVALRADSRTLSVVVIDDGRWAANADAASSGIAGLRERAEHWSGRAVVDHGGEFTRVYWRIPLDASGHPLVGG